MALTVGTSAKYIAADSSDRKGLSNTGGGTLYYKTTPDVSSLSNDGSVAVGEEIEVNAGIYLRSASQTRVVVRDIGFIGDGSESAGGSGITGLAFREVTSDHTLELSDDGYTLMVADPGDKEVGEEVVPNERTITVPADSNVNFPRGTRIGIFANTADLKGMIEIAGEDGVSFYEGGDEVDGFIAEEAFAWIYLVKFAADKWGAEFSRDYGSS